MNPMNTAPRDGTRILINTVVFGWCQTTNRMVETGEKWAECRWAKGLNAEWGWRFWCGSENSFSTDSPVPLGWAPRPQDDEHASDCATHNAPALEPGKCDCKVLEYTEDTVPAPDTIVRYKDGSFVPLMFHFADEGMSLKQIADSNGFHLYSTDMADDIDDEHPVWLACFEEGRSDMLPLWNPTPKPGYRLVAKYFSEDGPTALFIMRKDMKS